MVLMINMYFWGSGIVQLYTLLQTPFLREHIPRVHSNIYICIYWLYVSSTFEFHYNKYTDSSQSQLNVELYKNHVWLKHKSESEQEQHYSGWHSDVQYKNHVWLKHKAQSEQEQHYSEWHSNVQQNPLCWFFSFRYQYHLPNTHRKITVFVISINIAEQECQSLCKTVLPLHPSFVYCESQWQLYLLIFTQLGYKCLAHQRITLPRN